MRPRQLGFRKDRPCLISLIFYDRVAHLGDKGKALDVVCGAFIKVFDTVSHRILRETLAAHDLDRSSVLWVKNCLDGQAREWWGVE